MILDVIVGAAGQVLGDLTPSVTIRLVQLQDKSVLVLSPLDFLDIWVQVVVPSTYRNTIEDQISSLNSNGPMHITGIPAYGHKMLLMTNLPEIKYNRPQYSARLKSHFKFSY